MPYIASVISLELDHMTPQGALRKLARETFADCFDDLDRLLESFDNAGIEKRNLCVPVGYFEQHRNFRERNEDYSEIAIRLTSEAVEGALGRAGLSPNDATDLIFVSSTGLSTPSIDAFVVNKLRMNPGIRRNPMWGLGCAGGVSGIALAFRIASGNPDAVIAVAATELCSLTFLKSDKSKSNLIATGLFSDGAACTAVCGDNVKIPDDRNLGVSFIDSQSRFYYDTIDVMGWEITDDGLKVIFSRDIPTIVSEKVAGDVTGFLAKNNTSADEIRNFIVHPGGVKVISAYSGALGLRKDALEITGDVLRKYGNMSSATVMYVLDEFARRGVSPGKCLMASLGPGFSSEMILMEKRN
ncbi:MAG: type III polyketide synthase [Ignavibacteria bacterium]|nr:type III polyketide synthase [Ignavibacteria bacterium]